MTIFACPTCGKQLKVKDELVGKKVQCPACRQAVGVPTAGAETEGGASRGGDRWPSELTAFLAPPQAPDEIGRLGPYRVLEELGHGGMGVVFKAEDPSLGRVVALKAMLPALASSESARQRFFREAKAAAALKHPHVVTIFQVGEDRGAPFLAMEFLAGEALDVRHLDFGLARALADPTNLTQTGNIVGTPAYMAPEQAAGQAVDHRGDLFSLGCILYRMATGKLPFHGSNTMAILRALELDTPKAPREVNPAVPEALSDLVLRLLAKKPEKRPGRPRRWRRPWRRWRRGSRPRTCREPAR